MRVEYTGNGLLHAAFFIGCLAQRLLSLFQIEVVHVVASKLLDLNQKVSEVLFERGQILVEIEEAFDNESDLRTVKLREWVNKVSQKLEIKGSN